MCLYGVLEEGDVFSCWFVYYCPGLLACHHITSLLLPCTLTVISTISPSLRFSGPKGGRFVNLIDMLVLLPMTLYVDASSLIDYHLFLALFFPDRYELALVFAVAREDYLVAFF